MTRSLHPESRSCWQRSHCQRIASPRRAAPEFTPLQEIQRRFVFVRGVRQCGIVAGLAWSDDPPLTTDAPPPRKVTASHTASYRPGSPPGGSRRRGIPAPLRRPRSAGPLPADEDRALQQVVEAIGPRRAPRVSHPLPNVSRHIVQSFDQGRRVPSHTQHLANNRRQHGG